MQQGYWDKMRDFTDSASDYFSVVSKNEKDLMNTTKNLVMRTRMSREINFNEDFRKRFMTRDYGNYEKYDKNSIKEDKDRGEADFGEDMFLKNYHKMMKNLQLPDGDKVR